MRRGARRRRRLLARSLLPLGGLPSVDLADHRTFWAGALAARFGCRSSIPRFTPRSAASLLATVLSHMGSSRRLFASAHQNEEIPSIETNPDLVLEALIFLSLPPFYNPLIQDGWSSLTRHRTPSRGVLASVREKLHPILTTSTGSRDCHGGGGTRHIKPLPRRGRPCYKPCSLVYRFSASALWRCFTALISSRQTLLNGVNAGIK